MPTSTQWGSQSSAGEHKGSNTAGQLGQAHSDTNPAAGVRHSDPERRAANECLGGCRITTGSARAAGIGQRVVRFREQSKRFDKYKQRTTSIGSVLLQANTQSRQTKREARRIECGKRWEKLGKSWGC